MNNGRLKLHDELCLILGSDNVYFQPPESLKMSYPAIVYSRADVINTHASDSVYDTVVKYNVTIVDRDPDSVIVEKMIAFKHAVFERHYVASGLNHDMFVVSYTK